MTKPGGYMRGLILGLVLLAGCAGADGDTYIGRPESPAWFATASDTTINQHFQSRCLGYGFKPGSIEMAQCLQSESGTARQSAAIRSANASAGLQTSAAILAANRPRPPIHCTSTTTGVFTNTNCY